MRRLERFAISGRFALLPAVAAAMATVAAAAAFACTPQAYMSLDRQAYSPGDRVTIRGHLFDARSEIPVTVRAGADGVVLGQRRIARDGSWTLSFRLPRDTAAGSYLITAHAPGSYREIVGLTPEETAQAPWPAVRLALPVGLPAATRDNGAQRLKDALPRPQERPERADSRVRENARAGENDAKGSGRSPGPAEPGKSSAARPGATVSPTPAGARPTATVSPRPRGRVTPSDAGERARPDSSRPALRLRPAEPADSWATPSTAASLPPARVSPEEPIPEEPMIPWHFVVIGVLGLLLIGGTAGGVLIARRRRRPPLDAVDAMPGPIAPQPEADMSGADTSVDSPPDAVEAALQEMIAEHRAREGEPAGRS